MFSVLQGSYDAAGILKRKMSSAWNHQRGLSGREVIRGVSRKVSVLLTEIGPRVGLVL